MQVENVEGAVETAIDLLAAYGIKVIGAIALLVVGRMVAAIVRRTVRRGLQRVNVDATLVPFLSKGAYYMVLAVVLIAVLNLFGVQTASLVAVLGAAGLAVGLAMQGTLSNFSAGVMLLLFRPFKVGDFVDIAGTAGSVVEIGIFSTTLKTPDNVMIVAPNAQVYGQTIKNFNGYDTRRVDLVVGVAYDDDIQVALDTITRIVAADERVFAEPATQIAVSNLGESSVDIVVRPWCQASDYWNLRFELTRRLKEGLEAAGCSIPFPQRDVHLYQQTA